MRAVIRTDVVHAGCGGAIRERLYDDFDGEVERCNFSFAEGRLTYDQFVAKLDSIALAEGTAMGRPDKERDLECLYCGEDTAAFGTIDSPLRSYVRTVPATAYNGRIINPAPQEETR